MAEFCLDCWNKLNDTKLEERDVVLSTPEQELCEHCGVRGPVVVRTRTRGIRGLLLRLRGLLGR